MMYPKDTLGYHYQNAAIVFGSTSRPACYLKKKADDSVNGFFEKVVQDETQVLQLLTHMYTDEQREKGAAP